MQKRRRGRAVWLLFYPANTAPPLTLKTSPVMKLACGVHRNNTGAAISSGVPARPIGMVRRICAPLFGSANAAAVDSGPTHPRPPEFTSNPPEANPRHGHFTL